MSKKKKYIVYNRNLSIYFLSGIDDPCTLGAKGIVKSIKLLKSIGYLNIYAKSYENMRHEILQEKNKDEVFINIRKKEKI